MLIILFGLPGSGKTYIGEILKKYFDFFFYDIDNDITPGLKNIIAQGKIVSDETRNKFFKRVVQNVKKIYAQKNRMVIAQAFLKERDRKLFFKIFPDAKFIFIEAKSEIIKRRLDSRKHLISKDYAKKIEKIFELPKIKHLILKNNHGKKEIITQINKIFKN